MKKNYFQTIAKTLGHSTKKTYECNFVSLKAYEYWAKYISSSPKMPDVSDCILVLPCENARYISCEMADYYERQNEKLVAKYGKECFDLPSRYEKIKVPVEKDDFVFFPTRTSDDRKESDKFRDNNCIIKKLRSISPEVKDISVYGNTFFETLENESAFDEEAQKYFKKCLLKQFIQILENAPQKKDAYFKRVEIVKDAFNLTDDEIEIVLFAWIFFRKEICSELRQINKFGPRRIYGDGALEVYSSFFSQEILAQVFSQKSTFSRMKIFNDDMELSRKVVNFLDGKSNDNLEEAYYRAYEGPCVPYQDLRDNNAKIDVMFDLLKHAKPRHSLNIFFYGVEGTGKTELAKSIARETGKTLIMTNIKVDGTHKDNCGSSLLQDRMENIALASYKNAGKPVVILVDEADVILNGCEKGSLNFFMEQLQVPVIWISNNIGWTEKSTLRRFDYSLRFERLKADKRIRIWNSVIKTQNAEGLLSAESIERLASEIPVTAGGITQAISSARDLKQAGSVIDIEEIVRQVASAQAEHLGIEHEYGSRDTATHAPSYLLDALNIDADMDQVLKVVNSFDRKWQEFKPSDKPDSLNILLYGAPGTGKTEFARHIARTLNRKLIVRRASDLLGMFVGQSEKAIRDMFREAEEEKAILFLDEADSMIRDRTGAARSWEVTQVNELLTQMESFKGIFIAATNFNDCLDMASRRRFALKVKFDYLKPEGVEQIWKVFFPTVECPAEARTLKQLAPGDFNAAYGTLRFYAPEELTQERIMDALRTELAQKDGHEGRRMGL